VSITHRPFADEADYQQMRTLLVQTYALGDPATYCSIGELDWWRWGPREQPNPIALAELWWNDDTLIGIAWPSATWGKDMQVDLLAHPHHQTIEETMLDWVEAQQSAAPGSEPRSITAWAFTRDPRTQALQERGYALTGLAFSYLGQRLDAAFPVQPLPPGYAIRHVEGEADFPARVEVHRDAFAPSRLTVDIYRTLVAEAPTYRPTLDLVVVAPDDSFAAYCLVWFDAASLIGVFEPVGCHSAHRQKGLTKAVMFEGLRRLQALGAEHAYVATLRGEIAANNLYASVGFTEIDATEGWKKELDIPLG
jgi:predicted N-acetyltransferase YhbS